MWRVLKTLCFVLGALQLVGLTLTLLCGLLVMLLGTKPDTKFSTSPTAIPPREEVIKYHRTTDTARYDPYGFWGPATEEKGTIRLEK